jgi:hypothetical protein
VIVSLPRAAGNEVSSWAAVKEVIASPADEATSAFARNERVATAAATDDTVTAIIVREHLGVTRPSIDAHLPGKRTLKRNQRPARVGKPGRVERPELILDHETVTEKDHYVERRVGSIGDVVLAQGDLGGQARAPWPGGECEGTGRGIAAFADDPSTEIGSRRDYDTIPFAGRCSIRQRHIDELLGGHAHRRGFDGGNVCQRSRRHQGDEQPNSDTAHPELAALSPSEQKRYSSTP